MIGTPLALLGLLAIAVPVLIHLLGRHQSRIQRFPTLRFIPASRLAPTRRRRISDWPLMLVRCAIVAAAALALSQPYFAFAGREPAAGSAMVNRAIVVDTSLSMQRLVGGTRAVDSARALAATAGTSAITTTIETDDLRHGIRGALAWLDERRGSRELLVVSDFSGGMAGWWDGGMESADSAIGISLVQLAATGNVAIKASERPVAIPGPADSAGARAAWRAAGWTLEPASAGRIAIIYRSARERADLLARATNSSAPWSSSIVSELRRDRTLREASQGVRVESTPLDTVAGDISAGQVGDQLVLFVNGDPGGLTSAALTQALARILEPPMGTAEMDTTSVPSDALARWNRPAAPATNAPTDASDGRWLWALALALIVVETLMRRRAVKSAPAVEAPDATVGERAA